MNRKPPSRQMAVSVVELLVALTLGLLVVAGIGNLFVEHKGQYRMNEQLARIQENGRYALNLLASDLALAGFWGGLDCVATPCSPRVSINPADDCGASPPWALSSTPSIEYFLPTSTSSDPKTRFPCVKNQNDYWYKPGSSVLSVKHVRGLCVVPPGDNKKMYLKNSGGTGTLEAGTEEDAAETPCSTGSPGEVAAELWQYLVHIYYVGLGRSPTDCARYPGDGRCVPKLRRKALSRYSGKFSLNEVSGSGETAGELVEGIEYFHVLFGIDDSDPSSEGCQADGVPDLYLSRPTDPRALDCAVSAQIHLLVRSPEADFRYTDDKIYVLGDVNVNQLLNGGNPFRDPFRRKVFSTTVQLRNHR
ncbi:MAG TPA: PilW family protein [Methylococcus sp.]|nr:PilW family protein [Methylococcus sp.]